MPRPARDATAAHHLVRRFRQLRNWEGFNVAFLPALFLWLWRDAAPAWSLRLPPLAVVAFLLAQGTLYWHLKLRAVRDRAPLPPWFCGAFRLVRAASAAGLALALAATAVGAARRLGDAVDVAWALGLLAFALLEHVNYFHLQLKHDTAADWAWLRRNRRLRRAALATDLARACGDARPRTR